MLEKQYDYLDESYRNLVPLGKNSHKQTFLAQDNVTGKIVVKKYISAENAELYLRLKSGSDSASGKKESKSACDYGIYRWTDA